ncbi:DUF4192 domain-containing protein [Kitasatospora sp. NPDC004289]
MNEEHVIQSSAPLSGQFPLRMRGPADMAEMLPYLLGFFPDDSIVAVGLQGPALQQGGVIRLDIPADPATWPTVAADTARLLVGLSEQRDRRPEQVLLYLCRDAADPPGAAPPPDPAPPTAPGPLPLVLSRGAPGFDRVWPPGAEGPTEPGPPDGPSAEPVAGPGVVALLRPLAEQLAQEFRAVGVVVKESLCVSDGRWWSFLCGEAGCCDPAGVAIRSIRLPSPVAAAAAYAGVAPRGSRKAIAAGLAPIGPPGDDAQREALELAGPELIGELAGPGGRFAVLERTAGLLAEALADFGAGARELDPARTARLLVGLQDKLARDRGAEYAEPDELVPAQRLWRYLARRCVPPFEHYAAPPLTLLAWTSWLAGDTATARVVLARVLDLDQAYTLAQLLYESLNGGLHPGELLDRVRRERLARQQLAGLQRPAGDGLGLYGVRGPRAGAGPSAGAVPGVRAGGGPAASASADRRAPSPGEDAEPWAGHGVSGPDDPSEPRGERPPPADCAGPSDGGGRKSGGPGAPPPAAGGRSRGRTRGGPRGRAGRQGGAATAPEPGDEPPGASRTPRQPPRTARRKGRRNGGRSLGTAPVPPLVPGDGAAGHHQPEPTARARRSGRSA